MPEPMNIPPQADDRPPAPPSKSRFLIPELVAVIACFVLTKLFFDQIAWRFAGPMSMASTIAVVFIFARLRSESWSDFGLRRIAGLKAHLWMIPQILLGIFAIGATAAAANLGGEALGWWTIDVDVPEAQDRFAGLEGNLNLYLLWVGIAIFSAGIGEEVFFRGYLMRRIEGLFSPSAFTTVLMVLLPAIMFGIVHFYYLGIRGAVTITVLGVVIGSLYLLYRRNLWPLMAAHALIDIIGLTARYLDLDV